jgi:hypothetical protein
VVQNHNFKSRETSRITATQKRAQKGNIMSNLNTYLDRNNKVGRHPNQLLAGKSMDEGYGGDKSSISAMIERARQALKIPHEERSKNSRVLNGGRTY